MTLSEMVYPWARYSATIRDLGLSSCAMWSSVVDEETVAPALDARSSMVPAVVTWTCDLPSWVLSRSKAVFAALWNSQSRSLQTICHPGMVAGTYVSFSNVTVADLGASEAPDSGVMDREVILPLSSY